MKKTKLTCFFILSMAYVLCGQAAWIKPIYDDGKIHLKNTVNGKSIAAVLNQKTINYHPSFSLENKVIITSPKGSFGQCDIFAVFEENHSQEQLIWQLSEGSEDILLCTNQRVADLSKGKFYNYSNKTPRSLLVNNFHQYRGDINPSNLILGGLPKRTDLPVKELEDVILESIVFDKMLAPSIRQAFESYLAIKYGQSLSKGRSYTDDKGVVLFKNGLKSKYGNNIGCLGRNDLFKLNQKQTQTSLADGSISIYTGTKAKYNEHNKSKIAPNTYLFWSDNGLPLHFAKVNERPATLQRTWKVESKQFQSNSPLSLEVDNSSIFENESTYWLKVSKDEAQHPDKSTYYEFVTRDDLLHIDEISFYPQASYITIIQASDLWTDLKVDHPSCGQYDGSISAQIIGGKAPFNVSIKNNDTQVTEDFTTNDKILKRSSFEEGTYSMTVQDADGKRWQKQFHLNSINLEEYNIKDELISQDASIRYRLQSDDHELSIEWISPSGKSTQGTEVNFTESGQWTLQLEKNGCSAIKNVTIDLAQSNLLELSLYPNPVVQSGSITLQGELKIPSTYIIKIASTDGTLHRQTSHQESKYFHQTIEFPEPGNYVITIESNNSITSKKVIVLK